MDLSGTDHFLHLNKNRKRSKVIILLLFYIKHNINYSLKFVALIKNSLYYGYKK